GRLLADPAQERCQLRRPPQVSDGGVEGRQRFVREGGVYHAVALAAKKLHILMRASLFPREAMVLRQLAALAGSAAQRTRQVRRFLLEDSCFRRSTSRHDKDSAPAFSSIMVYGLHAPIKGLKAKEWYDAWLAGMCSPGRGPG